MSDDVDPASAVQSIDVGSARDESDPTTGEEKRDTATDAVDEATEDHRAAEGAESSPSLSSTKGMKNALLRTSPNTPLSRVESPWNPEEGGITRLYRGLQKALDFDGNPAIVDLVVGAVEAFHNFEPAGGGENPDADPDEESGEESPIVGGGGSSPDVL